MDLPGLDHYWLRVACPSCKAPIGAPCHDFTFWLRDLWGKPHAERVHQYRIDRYWRGQ
jgi:hypothetical protein